MAGPAQDVHVTTQAFEAKPAPWNLTTPQNAVRSYLDWTSYAYRIAESDVATATMGPDEGARIDSYIQYNLESSRLIDQTLNSLTFGKASVGTTSTLVPAHEKWTYRYVSTKTAGKTLAGPFPASYDTTYTVVKSGGKWLVYKVDVKALGAVK